MGRRRNKEKTSFIDNKKIEDSISVKRVIDSNEYPLFCFKYLSEKSIKKTKDYSFLIEFILRMCKLSKLGWEKIRQSGRHEYGLEKIPVDKLSVMMPSIVTEEVKELDVFRASSDKRVFIGLQENSIFHVFFIETKFNDFYIHGK